MRLYSPLWSLPAYWWRSQDLQSPLLCSLGSPALRGCKWLLTLSAVSWCPCLAFRPGLRPSWWRFYIWLGSLEKSALFVQCSGIVADDGLEFYSFRPPCLFWSAQGLRPCSVLYGLGRKEADLQIRVQCSRRALSPALIRFKFSGWVSVLVSVRMDSGRKTPYNVGCMDIVFLTNFCINDWF